MPISEAGALSPGAVVVVPFPYADRLAKKRRPAVIVSGPMVARAGFVWIAMITSARNAPMLGDHPIDDGAGAGLVAASVVRPTKLACIEPSRILRRIGTLSGPAGDDLFTQLRSMIGPS